MPRQAAGAAGRGARAQAHCRDAATGAMALAASSAGRANGSGRRASRKGRVALLAGCVNDILAPQINAAAIRVLTRHGIEVTCGARAQAVAARSSITWAARTRRWLRRASISTPGRRAGGLDAILITTSGCGTTVKDYGFMLRDDPVYAERAARIANLAKDIVRISRRAAARTRSGRSRACRRLSRRLLAAARPAHHRASRRNCSPSSASRSRTFPTVICAAARPAPTIFCSRTSQGGCASAKSGLSRDCDLK